MPCWQVRTVYAFASLAFFRMGPSKEQRMRSQRSFSCRGISGDRDNRQATHQLQLLRPEKVNLVPSGSLLWVKMLTQIWIRALEVCRGLPWWSVADPHAPILGPGFDHSAWN